MGNDKTVNDDWAGAAYLVADRLGAGCKLSALHSPYSVGEQLMFAVEHSAVGTSVRSDFTVDHNGGEYRFVKGTNPETGNPAFVPEECAV
ncbi:MAG: hypothetical protein H6860_01780 [Rhodospirillales bacterium]|nr:hypothetical protein [Alphaproteobacteria bacterium]MCB9981110.1 hypothetical protein [Rhodospirillales bacterium]